jgi:hypothetical protein
MKKSPYRICMGCRKSAEISALMQYSHDRYVHPHCIDALRQRGIKVTARNAAILLKGKK